MKIPESCAYVVEKTLLCKDLIFIKEEEEAWCNLFYTMSTKHVNHGAHLKQCDSAHQKFIEIKNKHRTFEHEQYEDARQKFAELENKPYTLKYDV